ncbi:hypothetical protein F4820DRAFT_438693 [Hypoxylon rubiginosum]|uniref:Uncharacterized protein n=1 Tax=Hypoxylon rubiginosum TaxID=110542 RepID=A0ACB9YLH9_9PEZI|nr:hypothetical protein F4820DRAFT_438693 [Hypoxylon rubiginosum]
MSALSFVTTLVPTGAISEWCVKERTPRAQLFGGAACPDNNYYRNASDFQSFCCDGPIVNTAFDMYNSSATSRPSPYPLPLASDGNGARTVYLSDLVCCGLAGTQPPAALDLWPSLKTACATSVQQPTPLLSLAASAASDAGVFPVTYAPTSSLAATATTGDESATVTNDLWGWASPTYGASGTPVCFYVNTVDGVDGSLAEVTVPATYVAPTSSATGSGSGGATSSATDSGSGSTAPVSTSVPSAGSSLTRAPQRNRVWVATLGLVTVSLLFS